MKAGLMMVFIFAALGLAPAGLRAENVGNIKCLNCHKRATPNVVMDWKFSKHSSEGITCAHCHGLEHTSSKDSEKAKLPQPSTCAKCHEEQVAQFRRGKHAISWAAMKAMPTTHMLPMALTKGSRGCGSCHKIGEKSPEEVAKLKAEGSGYGHAACDSCHTRHAFSKVEALQPQACQTCHMGFDHPQWEMYSTSKHGVRGLLKQSGVLPKTASGPVCQTCHMQDGDHEVRTPWGYLAVRLPLPEDEEWRKDQTTILQALGVLDTEGNPTARLEIFKAADVARLTQEAFDIEREKLLDTCTQCHSERFASGELAKGDELIKKADHLLAEAILIIASLYQDGILDKPESYTNAFPDLLTFHDAPRPIEQRLFLMHLEHRMRTFQGAFHANPDYALWYGWSKMVQDLTAIQEMAEELREKARNTGEHCEKSDTVTYTEVAKPTNQSLK
ncbi:MAG: cytochrome C [Gammaproteobacteria bacterium]|nr:MAG: cytochrome C [Gammaproteobacteria bacterium]RKZ72130.1 MAG: cytochrome C [Gammaproteobacteria bacterium]